MHKYLILGFTLLGVLFLNPLLAQEIVHTGEVTINGKPLKNNHSIKIGDTVEVIGEGSVRFNIGKDAFLLRDKTRARFEGSGGVEVIKVFSGSLMGVFGKGKKTLHTKTATIGIRGTGLYLETEKKRTYFCDCYGVIDVDANDRHLHHHPHQSTTLKSDHHDARFITDKGERFMIEPAGMLNHNDDELRLLEGMVGRKPYFDR